MNYIACFLLALGVGVPLCIKIDTPPILTGLICGGLNILFDFWFIGDLQF